MQNTIRAKMLNRLIYLLNNTDIESLKYDIKQQNITSNYTLIFTILAEKVVSIFTSQSSLSKEELKKQLEQEYDTYLKHSEQFVCDEFLE